MGKGRKQQMPPCLYGAACTRKGCAYRHPPKDKVEKTDQLCVAYLTHSCAFGAKCRNLHVDEEERVKQLEVFASRPCRFGKHCRTEGCLFMHPIAKPKPELEDQLQQQASKTVDDMEARRQQILAKQEQQKQMYEQRMQEFNVNVPSAPMVSPFVGTNVATDQSFASASQLAFMPTPAEQNFFSNQGSPSPWDAVQGSASAQNEVQSMAERLKQSVNIKPEQIQEQQTIALLGKQPPQVIKIPQETWVDASHRDPTVFNIQDPLLRFNEVNKVNKHPGIIDLHFQTSLTVESVLDSVLPNAHLYDTDQDDPNSGWVWVVTGTGHHTAQRLKKLFNVVQEYLDYYGYIYKIGKDSKGHYGAFYVRIKR